MAVINVQHDDLASFAGDDPDIGIRPLRPPFTDGSRINGRLSEPVRDQRVLAHTRTRTVATTTHPCLVRPMQWNDPATPASGAYGEFEFANPHRAELARCSEIPI